LECRQWDEFVIKIEFYALNLSCIMRIDVKGFVQWGYVSDIPLAGMDCVKYPDYYLVEVSHFISRSCNIISLCNLCHEGSSSLVGSQLMSRCVQ